MTLRYLSLATLALWLARGSGEVETARCQLIVADNSSQLRRVESVTTSPAGLVIQMSHSGLAYFAQLVEKSIPLTLENLTIPELKEALYEVTEIKLVKVDNPTILTGFDPGVGMQVCVTIPKLSLSAKYDIGAGFFSTSGKVIAEVTQLFASLVFTFVHEDNNPAPTIHVQKCNSTVQRTVVAFQGDSVSSAANMARGAIEEFIATEVQNLLCQSAIKSSEFYEEEVVVKESANPSICDDPSGSGAQPAAFNFSQPGMAKFKQLQLNMTLSQDPFFTWNDGFLFFDAQFLYESQPSGLRPFWRDLDLSTPERMARVIVSESLVNSFFAQVHKHKLIKIIKDLSVEQIKNQRIRGVIRFVCPGCGLHLEVETQHSPRLIIGPHGLYLKLSGWIVSKLTGSLSKVYLVEGSFEVSARVRPYLMRSRLLGNIDSIQLVKTELTHKGFGFLLNLAGNQIRSFMNSFIIPEFILPEIRKKLDVLMGREGIQLPVVCGLQIVDPIIHLLEGAVVVEANFNYSAQELSDRVKTMLSSSLQPSPTVAIDF